MHSGAASHVEPALDWQAPVGPLQDMRNAASVGQVDVDSRISQNICGEGEHWADPITSNGFKMLQRHHSRWSNINPMSIRNAQVFPQDWTELLKLNVKSSPKLP